MNTRSYLAGLSLIAVFIIAPGAAHANHGSAPADELVLGAERQDALAAFTAFLADPPQGAIFSLLVIVVIFFGLLVLRKKNK